MIKNFYFNVKCAIQLRKYKYVDHLTNFNLLCTMCTRVKL